MSCSSCGMPAEGSSCSMCYGDIDHGNDGYYLAWAEEQNRQEEEERMYREQIGALRQQYRLDQTCGACPEQYDAYKEPTVQEGFDKIHYIEFDQILTGIVL